MTGVIEYVRNVTEEKRMHDELLAAYEQLAATEEELREQYGEQVKIQGALLESENLYRLVVENSHDGIYIHQNDRFLFVNEKASEISGYSRQELMGMCIWDLVHPDDRAALQESQIKRVSGTVLPPYFFARILTRSGKEIQGNFFVDLVTVQDQPAILGIVREVKNPEIAGTPGQDRVEGWFRTLVETFPYMIWEVDPEGRFRYISPQIRDIMGYDPSEVIGKSVTTLVPEFARSFVENEILVGTKSPASPYTVEVPARHRDGRDICIEIRSGRVFDKNGAFAGMRGTAADITEQKRARLVIHENEELFSKLVNTVPDIVIRTDLEGNIVYVNRQGLEFGGYDRVEDVAGRPVVQFVDFEDHARIAKNMRLMFEAPRGPVEYTAIRRDGSRVVIEVNGDVLRMPDGTPIGLVFVCRDITCRKQAEDALVALNRKLQLLSGVTRHDILNNVMVMLGHLDLAKNQENPAEITALISKLEVIVRDIWSQIDFTRVYENLGTDKPQWQGILSLTRSLHIPPHIAYQGPAADREVFADAMLVKVFEILLDNSLRHGQSVTRIGIHVEEKPDGLGIVYEDNGVGIPVGIKEKIFELGYGQNTGLGLFFAREVLSLTGITISENGMPGSGVRFGMTVPRGTYR